MPTPSATPPHATAEGSPNSDLALTVLSIGIPHPADASASPHRCNNVNNATQVAAAFDDVPQLNADRVALWPPNDNALALTQKDVLQQITRLADEVSPRGRVIFYFAGRATQLDGQDDLFLIPSDCSAVLHPDSLVSFTEVLRILERSASSENLVLLDINHERQLSGNAKDNMSKIFSMTDAASSVSSGSSTVLLATIPIELQSESSPNPKLGTFAFHLIQALRGAPEALDDRKLTMDSLCRFLTSKAESPHNPLQVTQLISSGASTSSNPLADFSQLLTTPHSSAPTQHPFFELTFMSSYPERTKAILTEWKNRAKTPDQLQFAANTDEAMEAYLADTFARLRPVLRKRFGLSSSDIETTGATFHFPGGTLTHRYETANRDRGVIVRELVVDTDWFTNGPQLALLLETFEFNTEWFTLGLNGALDPLEQAAGLEANGWEIESETPEQLIAHKQKITLTVATDSVSFKGFDIQRILENSEEPNEEQQEFTETVQVLVPTPER